MGSRQQLLLSYNSKSTNRIERVAGDFLINTEEKINYYE